MATYSFTKKGSPTIRIDGAVLDTSQWSEWHFSSVPRSLNQYEPYPYRLVCPDGEIKVSMFRIIEQDNSTILDLVTEYPVPDLHKPYSGPVYTWDDLLALFTGEQEAS